MDIVYYPDILIYSEETLKTMLLFWNNIRTIAPLSEKFRIEAYLEGNIHNWQDNSLERYKTVLHLAGEPILDFITITGEDREKACDTMLTLVAEWNKDSHFYNSLKISPDTFYAKNRLETYSLFEDKIEKNLRELLLRENLLIRKNRQLVGFPQISKSYMSIMAEEIKKRHNVRILTDDEFCLASKSGAGLRRVGSEEDLFNSYQTVAIDIPQVFIPPEIIHGLSWKQIIKIREDLIPLAEQYHREIEEYQQSINALQIAGKKQEALEKLREFCERTANSFKPFSKEVSKILGMVETIRTHGLITDFIIPTLMLLEPELNKTFAIVTLSINVTKYILPRPSITGFDYLENLNRRLRSERFKQTITRLIPRNQRFHKFWLR